MNPKQLLVTSVAIATTTATATPAHADPVQWIRREVIDPMFSIRQPQRQQSTIIRVRPQYTPLQPVTRQGFGYVHDLGGGVDEEGYYRRPIPSDRAFGVQLHDGVYEAPMQWEGDDPNGGRIRYEVQGGQIIRQRYGFE